SIKRVHSRPPRSVPTRKLWPPISSRRMIETRPSWLYTRLERANRYATSSQGIHHGNRFHRYPERRFRIASHRNGAYGEGTDHQGRLPSKWRGRVRFIQRKGRSFDGSAQTRGQAQRRAN